LAVITGNVLADTAEFKEQLKISDGSVVTQGSQTYSGAIEILSNTGQATERTRNENEAPLHPSQDVARAANFKSANGNITFNQQVLTNNRHNLIVDAPNGSVTINDQIGVKVVEGNDRIAYRIFTDNESVNPSRVDIFANRININANVSSLSSQRFTGDIWIGDNGSNGFDRILVSVNPMIALDGPVNDSVIGRHNLILRAIQRPNGQVDPVVFLPKEGIGQKVPLRDFDVLLGKQNPSSMVANILPDRSTDFSGKIIISGSVSTVGNQTYVGRDIAVDSSIQTVVFKTETGTIEAITGLSNNRPNSIVGLENSRFERGPRAKGVGDELRDNARQNGITLDIKIVGRLPSEEAEQAGSGMVSALKRSIDRIQTRQPGLDEMLEINGLASAGGEVSIGALQDVSGASMSESLTPGAVQIDCSDQVVAMANTEQCSTTNPN
jgi:hypothetical protein